MKSTLRKICYLLLYALVIVAFVYLGSKDYSKDNYKNDAERFSSDYAKVPKDNKFIYLNSRELLRELKSDNAIIFIGDKESEWSQRYAVYLNEIASSLNVDKIYYHDARKVKQLKNKYYYQIINTLKGNLIETDDSDDNLFTPSLYIIKSGKVVYHNATSAVVRNEDKVETYWTLEKEQSFKNEIINAINNNYIK